MPSHRFSMLASVGFEMAWVVEAARTASMVVGRAACTRTALRSRLAVGVRSILAGVIVEKRREIKDCDGLVWWEGRWVQLSRREAGEVGSIGSKESWDVLSEGFFRLVLRCGFGLTSFPS